MQENHINNNEKLLKIEDLVIGSNYNNNDITKIFKCDNMRGMRRSKETNSLVLIAKHVDNLYDDKWRGNTLHYTGEGQEGDQKLAGQNKTLYESHSNGINVYLFEVFKAKEYTYQGEVYLSNNPYQSDQIDKNGNNRKVWIFPLTKKPSKEKNLLSYNTIADNQKSKEKTFRKLNIEELKNKAKHINPNPGKRLLTIDYRERNVIISEITKKRAKGRCDLCGAKAPFHNKDGVPYLETHHVITLAENGPDQIYNTVALCPNCHRKMHVNPSRLDNKKLSRMIYSYLINDDDQYYIKEFEKLFKNL